MHLLLRENTQVEKLNCEINGKFKCEINEHMKNVVTHQSYARKNLMLINILYRTYPQAQIQQTHQLQGLIF